MQMWYIYMLEVYSTVKKSKITKFAEKGCMRKLVYEVG